MVLLKPLTVGVLIDAEGMGFEPTCNSAANVNNVACACDKVPKTPAACIAACRLDASKWLESALNDIDLQHLIAAWDGLPDAIRRAVMALIESQEA